MVKLRNTNPLGAVELPLIGRVLEPGEEFEVTEEQAGHAPVAATDDEPADPGSGLLAQVGNYELVASELDGMTIPELQAYGAAHDIDLAGLTKKPDILAAIKKG